MHWHKFQNVTLVTFRVNLVELVCDTGWSQPVIYCWCFKFNCLVHCRALCRLVALQTMNMCVSTHPAGCQLLWKLRCLLNFQIHISYFEEKNQLHTPFFFTLKFRTDIIGVPNKIKYNYAFKYKGTKKRKLKYSRKNQLTPVQPVNYMFGKYVLVSRLVRHLLNANVCQIYVYSFHRPLSQWHRPLYSQLCNTCSYQSCLW